jgi:hypothetical protein
MSRYALLNAHAVAVAMILMKAERRAFMALKEFPLSRKEKGQESMSW